ncbi:hypothetical protein BDW59DRAFT_158423 [Aspergillus cavernicola]|uniref:BZIP domain-containing protein n=1 Tax=Aspergillus cavernicola TaxID=176166 RepID=A0ABR4IRZ5_9EURO
MFQTPHHISSYFVGGMDEISLSSHPAQLKIPTTELGDESRMGVPHWIAHPECLLPSDLTTPTTGTDDVFSFPSSSTGSSPHMSQLSVLKDGELPDGEEFGHHHKATVRRSQNRQAQRRFRERKEQQKTALVTTLEDVQSKHDELADLINRVRQTNRSLETDKKRLEREVDTLRKWRQKILGVMSDLVQEDRSADDLLTKVATSCSITCWRKGIQYSRTYIIMQTLLSLFEEFQIPTGSSSETETATMTTSTTATTATTTTRVREDNSAHKAEDEHGKKLDN